MPNIYLKTRNLVNCLHNSSLFRIGNDVTQSPRRSDVKTQLIN